MVDWSQIFIVSYANFKQDTQQTNSFWTLVSFHIILSMLHFYLTNDICSKAADIVKAKNREVFFISGCK